MAVEAGQRFEDAPPEAVIRWAAETFGDEFCIAASMADALLIDIASRAAPDVHVVFLDTGYHFTETIAYRDRMAAAWNLTVCSLMFNRRAICRLVRPRAIS